VESDEQFERVRERFTRTARQFAEFSLSNRRAEAEALLRLAAPRGTEGAVDVACGPGTFTCTFAPRVARILGVDLTPAILWQGRAAAERAGLANVAFALGDAHWLPLGDAAFDLGVCGYSIHHFSDPLRALGEMARVLKPGGRLALADIIVPDGADPEAANAIERARDASHCATLTRAQFESLLAAARLRILSLEASSRQRSFRDWMRISGWSPGDAAYAETRRMMEEHLERDRSGFAPQRVAASDDLKFIQPSLFLLAERA
jgi:ubiquinone/menaquinone biosynthesis C-methylase UbiE